MRDSLAMGERRCVSTPTEDSDLRSRSPASLEDTSWLAGPPWTTLAAGAVASAWREGDRDCNNPGSLGPREPESSEIAPGPGAAGAGWGAGWVASDGAWPVVGGGCGGGWTACTCRTAEPAGCGAWTSCTRCGAEPAESCPFTHLAREST